jgi:hypothetical protein
MPNYSGIPLQEAAALEDRYVLIQAPFYQPVRARNRPRRQAVIRSVAGDPLTEILVGEERVGIVGQSGKLVRSRGVSALYDRASGERVDLAADDDSLRNELDVPGSPWGIRSSDDSSRRFESLRPEGTPGWEVYACCAVFLRRHGCDNTFLPQLGPSSIHAPDLSRMIRAKTVGPSDNRASVQLSR